MALMIPVHEQLYPSKLLPTRLEEYVLDGQPPTQNRHAAILLSGAKVLATVHTAQGSTGLANIDPRYYVGTCFHEAGCTNEWDTEIATASCPSGFQSVGAYQIGAEEATTYGFQLVDMLDFGNATTCMIKLAEYNRSRLRTFAGLTPGMPDPDYVAPNGTTWTAGTMRAYLAIAHNHGLGYAQITIARYGMYWPAYKIRNPTDDIVAHGYGEDCATGGPYWPRVIQLTTPNMTGPDVILLQRAIGADMDGDFGPESEAALKSWQAAHNVSQTGVCDLTTWEALFTT
jgi:peptidoglycan hydrolase-like protein with peptidoglycan-binding domain